MAIRIKNRMPYPFYTSHASSFPVLPTRYTHLCLPHTSCFIPASWHPTIFVSLLPIFECVLYGTHRLAPIRHRPFYNPLRRRHVPLAILHQTSPPFLGPLLREHEHDRRHHPNPPPMLRTMVRAHPWPHPSQQLHEGLPRRSSLARIDALFHSRAFRTLLISCRPTCGPSNLRNHWCPVDVPASFNEGLASNLKVPLTFMSTRPMFPLWVVKPLRPSPGSR